MKTSNIHVGNPFYFSVLSLPINLNRPSSSVLLRCRSFDSFMSIITVRLHKPIPVCVWLLKPFPDGNASTCEFLLLINFFLLFSWTSFFIFLEKNYIVIRFMLGWKESGIVCKSFGRQSEDWQDIYGVFSRTCYNHFINAIPKLSLFSFFFCDRKSRASFCNLTLMAAVRATNLAWVVSVTSCAAGAPSAGNACDALKNGTCAQMSNPTKSS